MHHVQTIKDELRGEIKNAFFLCYYFLIEFFMITIVKKRVALSYLSHLDRSRSLKKQANIYQQRQIRIEVELESRMMGDYLVRFGEGSNTKALFNMFLRKVHSI